MPPAEKWSEQMACAGATCSFGDLEIPSRHRTDVRQEVDFVGQTKALVSRERILHGVSSSFLSWLAS
jgi:hypothetical protein